jgi:predicted Zn-dependent protease
MLGVALFQQGKPDAALTAMQAALRRHDGHASWQHNLSLVLNALERCEEAQAAQAKAQRLKNLHDEAGAEWQLG